MKLNPATRFFAVAAVLCLVLISGCSSPEEAAAGTYVLDKENIKDAMRKELEAEQDPMQKMGLEMGMQMIDGMTMTLTLNADGTASSSVNMADETQSSSGRWTIDGDTVTVTMTDEDGESQSLTGTLKDDHLEFDPPAESDMPFKMIFRKQ